MSALAEDQVKCKKVVIQTCSWGLGRFPIAKTFIQEDVPSFGELVQVDYRAGGNPRFACKDEYDVVVKVTDFSGMNRIQMRQTLAELGLEPIAELSILTDEL